jgi:hypothetical protein
LNIEVDPQNNVRLLHKQPSRPPMPLEYLRI